MLPGWLPHSFAQLSVCRFDNDLASKIKQDNFFFWGPRVSFRPRACSPFSSSSSLLGLVDYLVLFLQSVAALAAACTAVCASTENATYHQIAAATFFIAGNLGAVAICVVDGVRHMSSTTSDCGHRGGSNGWKMRALLAATGTILMAVHCGLCYFSPNPCGSAMSALEWADVLILIAFYTYNCLGRDGTATMGLAVITGTPSEQKGPCKA